MGDGLACSLDVNLVAHGFERYFEDSPLETKDAFGEPYESMDTLLNTSTICAARWFRKTVWDDIKNFEKDKSLITGPIPESEIATWPGEYECEPLLELNVADQVGMVDRSRARWIHGHHVPGRFVNGRFIKGK